MSDASGTSEFEDGAPSPGPPVRGHKGPRVRVDGARKDTELSVAAPPSPQAPAGSRGAATPLAPPIAAAGPNGAPQVEIGSGGNPARKVRVGSRGSIRTARRDIDPVDSEAPESPIQWH